MDVQLIIKAPNQNVDDHVVDCTMDWTIQELKIHLSENYPDRPLVGDQKLIYSGRLLKDHLHLKDILRQEEDDSAVYTLHLVCNHVLPSQSGNTSSSQNWSGQSSHSRNSNPGQSSENTLRRRNTTSPSNSVYPQLNQGSSRQSPMSVFVPDSQVAAQIAAMQQMYAYYFTQYIQSVNPTPDAGSNSTFPGFPNYQPPEADIPAQGLGEQRMNAQGGQIFEENDEVNHRDWLDQIFVWARFSVLIFILYLYSTPERLMIVVTFAVMAFLYNEGWFMRRREQPNPVANVQENANPIGDAQDIDEVDDPHLLPNFVQEGQGERELEAAMDGDDPPHARPPPARNNNYIFSPLTFLTTFFSSLIPEPPPAVNIN